MSQTANELIDFLEPMAPVKIAEWMRSQGYTGPSHSGMACPLARALQDTEPRPSFSVVGTSVAFASFKDLYLRLMLGENLQEFIHCHDRGDYPFLAGV